ncbi:MAG: GAF domain-containing protein [Anaerolineales bacterium]|nr:GAF domain-containing protein [Anaerolineales bacterium]
MSSNLALFIGLWSLGLTFIALHRIGFRTSRTLLRVTLGGLVMLNTWRPLLLAVLQATPGITTVDPDLPILVAPRILGPIIYLTILLVATSDGPLQANLLAFNVSVVTIVGAVIYVAATFLLGPIVIDTSPSLAPAILEIGFQQHVANTFAFIVGVYLSTVVYQLIAGRWPRRSAWFAGGAVMLGGWVEAILFIIGGYWNTPWWTLMMQAELLGWALAALALWPLATIYILYLRRRQEEAGWGYSFSARPALEVVRETLDMRIALDESKRRLFQLGETFRLLNEVRAHILSAGDPDRLMQGVCDLLVRSGGYSLVWVGLMHEKDQGIYPAASSGRDGGYLRSITITWDEAPTAYGPTGTSVRENRPDVVHDIADEPRFAPWREQALARGYRSSAAFPLGLEGNVFGVLNVYANQPEVFDAEVVRTMQAVADDLAQGISRLQLQQQRAQRVRELNAISHLTVEMVSQHDVSALLQSIVLEATDLLSGSSSGMYLSEPNKALVRCAVSYRTARDYTGTTLRYGEGVAGHVAETGEALIISDYRIWPNRAEVFEDESSFVSVLSAPMMWQGQVTGVINIMREEEDAPFAQADLDLLNLFANQAAVALQNARLIEGTQRRLRQSSLLNEITRITLSGEGVEIIPGMAARLAEIIEADTCLIALWDEEGHRPRYEAGYGLFQPDMFRDSLPTAGERTLVEAALVAGKPIVIEDVSSSPLTNSGFVKMASSVQVHSLITTPFIIGDHWYGAAIAGFNEPRRFTENEINTCEQVAKQVSLALAISVAYESERRRSGELEAVRQASLRLTSSLELQPVLETILEQTLNLVAADDAHIFLFDGERLAFGAALWAGDVQRQPFSEPRHGGLTYAVARSGERIVITNVDHHELFQEYQWGGAIVGLPLKIGRRVLGVMNVALVEPHEFQDAELRVLELLADQAAVAVENVRLFEQSESERQRVLLLYDVAQELARLMDPEEILQRAVTLICDNFGGQSAEAFVIESSSERMRLCASVRKDGIPIPELDERIDMRLGKGLVGWVAQELQGCVIPDVTENERWFPIPGVDESVRSALCVPILTNEELQAVIGVFHQEVNEFQPEHLDLMVAIGHQVGLAMSNARRYQQIDRRLAELTVLRQVAQVVNRSLEMQPLLEEVVRQVGEVLGYPVVEIYLIEEEELVLGAVRGAMEDEAVRFPMSQGVTGRAVRINEPVHVPDVRMDPDYIAAREETQCEIAVPLRKEDVVIGVLNVESPVLGGLNEDDVRLLMLLADNISVAVENAALYERLRLHADELERTVSERTAALAEALKQAQEADRLKTQFVSDVSHELRTPLSNIMLYLELIESGKRERFQSYLETLNRETARLVILIEDLLTVSRLDAGTATLDPKEINLNFIAQSLVEDRERLFAEKALRVGFKLHEDLPHVYADERMLSRVVANLMTNAMHYTQPGGTVTITTDMKDDGECRWATLAVADTGLGISNEEQEFLFQRFFRGSASRKMSTPGTGLGLAICREIMLRHSGRITVESHVGQGSTFTIWFPIDGGPERVSAAVQPTDAHPPTQKS